MLPGHQPTSVDTQFSCVGPLVKNSRGTAVINSQGASPRDRRRFSRCQPRRGIGSLCRPFAARNRSHPGKLPVISERSEGSRTDVRSRRSFAALRMTFAPRTVTRGPHHEKALDSRGLRPWLLPNALRGFPISARSTSDPTRRATAPWPRHLRQRPPRPCRPRGAGNSMPCSPPPGLQKFQATSDRRAREA